MSLINNNLPINARQFHNNHIGNVIGKNNINNNVPIIKPPFAR